MFNLKVIIMTRKLQLLLTVLLLTAGVTSAWAQTDNTTASVYCPLTGAYYDDVLSAFNAIKANEATDLEIQIVKSRPKLSASGTDNGRIDVPAGKTLTIKPTIDGIILTAGGHNRGNIWFLNVQDNSTFIIGDAAHNMTIEGYGLNDNNRQLNGVCSNEKKGVMQITNVTFSKFRLGTNGTKYGSLVTNKDVATSSTEAFTVLTDVTINNSLCDDGCYFVNSNNTNNDAICLKGYFNVNDNCYGTHFSLKGRIKLGDKASNNIDSGFTASNGVTFYWAVTTTIGTNVLVKVPSSQATGVFDVTNDGYGLVRSGSGGDMKLTQAYTLPVTSAGAATLVLPFEATIPAGVSAYTLNYTSGNSSVKATEVTTTLNANTPVLVNASEGNYKFVSTATSGSPATGSEPVTSGALTGVYTATWCPKSSYILGVNDNVVAFYHPAGENTNNVPAYRAYLTADGAGARLSINFGGEETAISDIQAEQKGEGYYNLRGQRVENPTKGLYIVNGKKVIIK